MPLVHIRLTCGKHCDLLSPPTCRELARPLPPRRAVPVMARKYVPSESEQNARRETLRSASGFAIVTKQRRARDSLVAQQRASNLATPDRRSARVQARGGAIKLLFSPTGSTESASREADPDYSPVKTVMVRLFDADGSAYNTPLKFSKDEARPRSYQLFSSYASDNGVLRCIITGQSNKNGTIQFAHVADRSLDNDMVREYTVFSGMMLMRFSTAPSAGKSFRNATQDHVPRYAAKHHPSCVARPIIF